jgi:hypothetical protein
MGTIGFKLLTSPREAQDRSNNRGGEHLLWVWGDVLIIAHRYQDELRRLRAGIRSMSEGTMHGVDLTVVAHSFDLTSNTVPLTR